MRTRPIQPATEADIFEANYLTSSLRARRDFSWAQRRAVLAVLTGAAPDPQAAAPEAQEPSLRSFALILARCESAATLLGWRKQITPEQKLRLDAAVHQLQEAATQVPVRASVHPIAPKRARFSPLLRISRG